MFKIIHIPTAQPVVDDISYLKDITCSEEVYVDSNTNDTFGVVLVSTIELANEYINQHKFYVLRDAGIMLVDTEDMFQAYYPDSKPLVKESLAIVEVPDV